LGPFPAPTDTFSKALGIIKIVGIPACPSAGVQKKKRKKKTGITYDIAFDI
jgi:hypothetical protein